MRKILIAGIIAVSFVMPAFAIQDDDGHDELFKAPVVLDGTVLSMKDCVALAFKNSPKIRRKKYELDIAKSNVGIAKSKFFPVIGAGVGFNYERNSDGVYYDKKYRDLPYVGVTVNQLVYDFGKTNSYIKMEEFYKIGAEYEFIDEICHTLFEIKAEYYKLLQKAAILALIQKDVEINKEFVKIAKGKPDLTTAEINLTDAQIRLIDAEQELQNAKYNLSNDMYLDNHINYSINNTPTFNYSVSKVNLSDFKPIVFPFTDEEAPNIAYKNSPDLQVIISTRNAMEQALKYTKRQFMPDLSAGVGYGLNNTYNTTNNSLKVGVGLSSDVNLKHLKHSIDAAKAELNVANNEISLFKRDLYYEVKRALNNVEKTQKQLNPAEKEIEQAIKNLELVKNGYLADELDYTTLQTARKDFIKAQTRYITSLYDYNMAIIQTEMAMHYHIADIHHKTEHALQNHADELLEHLNEALDCDENETKSNKGKKDKKHKSVKFL